MLEKQAFYTTTVLNRVVNEKLEKYCKQYSLSKSSMIRLLITLGVDNDILGVASYDNIKHINSAIDGGDTYDH